MRAKLGPDDPATFNTMHNLANAYRATGKLDLALPLFEETLKLHKDKLGANHPATLKTMNNLGWCVFRCQETESGSAALGRNPEADES